MKVGDKGFYFEEFGEPSIECEIVEKHLSNYFIITLENTQRLTIHKGNLYPIAHLGEYKIASLRYTSFANSVVSLRERLLEQELLLLKEQVLFYANSIR